MFEKIKYSLLYGVIAFLLTGSPGAIATLAQPATQDQAPGKSVLLAVVSKSDSSDSQGNLDAVV